MSFSNDQSPPTDTANGTIKTIDGCQKIYFDGYWIRYYPPGEESLLGKKRLIESLKRRLFHHTESGINTPGRNLELARIAYEREHDTQRKRVNGAMLAGALFNRATDIFTSVVDLEAHGVTISPDNELMRQCGDYFQEALELGKLVKHHSGHEGVDELWGEPLKAFTLSIEEFYTTRYIKLSQTMRDIDKIAARLVEVFADEPGFEPIVVEIERFATIAKLETETFRSDTAMFDVWPRFVACAEKLTDFVPTSKPEQPLQSARHELGLMLLQDGRRLIAYLAGVRTPMPKSTQELLDDCDKFVRTRR